MLPASKMRPMRKHLTAFFDKTKKEKKKIIIVGDFNINALDYSKNRTIKNFVNLMLAPVMTSSITMDMGFLGIL